MRVLVFQHLACEHPGVFRRFLEEDGIAWDTVELDQGESIPSPDDYDVLWVMGGPMDVWETAAHPWLDSEKAVIRDWIEVARKPFLGVCLGHQLMADALGGRCELQPSPEVGIHQVELTDAARSDPVFSSLAMVQKCLQWHSVGVVNPPPGATVLAGSLVCPCQAMTVGRYAYGVQYHIEIERDTIPTWGAIPEYAASLARTLGEGALSRLQAEAEPLIEQFEAGAREFYRGFMNMASEKTRQLGSESS